MTAAWGRINARRRRISRLPDLRNCLGPSAERQQYRLPHAALSQGKTAVPGPGCSARSLSGEARLCEPTQCQPYGCFYCRPSLVPLVFLNQALRIPCSLGPTSRFWATMCDAQTRSTACKDGCVRDAHERVRWSGQTRRKNRPAVKEPRQRLPLSASQRTWLDLPLGRPCSE